ncbi:MAG: chromate transporter [Treponema sp.]|nr:chromate transporter [Treponema sp.]
MKSSVKEKIKMLFQLYFAFAKVGSVTFGGGLAMMPMLQKELGEKRGWITDDDLIDYYAIGQSTPGIVAVNVATFVGFKQAGVLGGIFATLGIVTPSLVIIMILASLISSIEEYPLVQKALKGVNVAVAALLSKVAYDFSKKILKNIFALFIALLSFFLVGILKVQSFYIILGAIALGSVIHFYLNRKDKNV